MSQSGSGKKVANRLVALSSAAVLTVYAAGYVRTRPAAERFAVQAAERRPSAQRPPDTATVEIAAVAPTPAAAPAPTEATRRDPAAESPQVTAAAPKAVEEFLPAQVPTQAPTQVPQATPAATIPVPETKVEIPAAVTPAPAVAPAPPTLPAPAPAPPAQHVWKDGTYLGWGTSRHGDIQAQVKIAGGRIESAVIAQCLTRYSCNVIEHLPPQVAQRQSPDVDTVSRATQSADAFYWAVMDALAKAK